MLLNLQYAIYLNFIGALNIVYSPVMKPFPRTNVRYYGCITYVPDGDLSF